MSISTHAHWQLFAVRAMFFVALLSPAAFARERPPKDLVGAWGARDPAAGVSLALVLNADGTGTFDGDPIRFVVRGRQIVVTEADGEELAYDYRLEENRLTLSGGDLEEPFVFSRSEARGDVEQTKPPADRTLPPPGDAKPAPVAPADRTAPAEESGLLGTWQADDGACFVFHPDGSAEFPTGRLKYAADGRTLRLAGPNGELAIAYTVDGDTLKISVEGHSQTLRRVGAGRARADRGDADRPVDDTTGIAGVYVCTESSVDPSNLMTYTQYVTFYPDGSVGYAKTEGGASREQVSDSLERFNSFRNTGAESVAGRWEASGGGIVVRWNLWNNLVSEGEADGTAITLSRMGVLEEGATLRFEKQR